MSEATGATPGSLNNPPTTSFFTPLNMKEDQKGEKTSDSGHYFYWSIIILVTLTLISLTYWKAPELLALVVLATLCLVGLAFLAYVTPMNAKQNEIDWKVMIVVFIAFGVGLGLGTLPPFAQYVRYYFWDIAVFGGFSSVTLALEDAEPTKIIVTPDDTLTVEKISKIDTVNGEEEEDPVEKRRFQIQVKYLDESGSPYYEVIEKGRSMKLPLGWKSASARYLRGNQVTGWTDYVPKPTKVTFSAEDILTVAAEEKQDPVNTKGFRIQVRYIDGKNKPHDLLVTEDRSIKLPPGWAYASARYIRGKQVTEWSPAVRE